MIWIFALEIRSQCWAQQQPDFTGNDILSSTVDTDHHLPSMFTAPWNSMSSDDLTSGSLEHQVPSEGGLQQLLQSTPPLPRPSKVSESVRNLAAPSWKILEGPERSVLIFCNSPNLSAWKLAALIYVFFASIWFNQFWRWDSPTFCRLADLCSISHQNHTHGFCMVLPILCLRKDLCRISAPVYFAAEAQPESQAAHCQPSDKIKLWRLYENAKRWIGSVYNVCRRTSRIPLVTSQVENCHPKQKTTSIPPTPSY